MDFVGYGAVFEGSPDVASGGGEVGSREDPGLDSIDSC